MQGYDGPLNLLFAFWAVGKSFCYLLNTDQLHKYRNATFYTQELGVKTKTEWNWKEWNWGSTCIICLVVFKQLVHEYSYLSTLKTYSQTRTLNLILNRMPFVTLLLTWTLTQTLRLKSFIKPRRKIQFLQLAGFSPVISVHQVGKCKSLDYADRHTQRLLPTHSILFDILCCRFPIPFKSQTWVQLFELGFHLTPWSTVQWSRTWNWKCVWIWIEI